MFLWHVWKSCKVLKIVFQLSFHFSRNSLQVLLLCHCLQVKCWQWTWPSLTLSSEDRLEGRLFCLSVTAVLASTHRSSSGSSRGRSPSRWSSLLEQTSLEPWGRSTETASWCLRTAPCFSTTSDCPMMELMMWRSPSQTTPSQERAPSCFLWMVGRKV